MLLLFKQANTKVTGKHVGFCLRPREGRKERGYNQVTLHTCEKLSKSPQDILIKSKVHSWKGSRLKREPTTVV